MLFAKNSDRPADETQVVESRAPTAARARHALQTQYLALPTPAPPRRSCRDRRGCAEPSTALNEHRVAIGNEKIWTVDDPRGQPPALLGMDLVALVLERARDADEGSTC